MSVTGVESQIARWKHRTQEITEQHCEIKAPNERTEQRESVGDGDDMEADILHVKTSHHLYLTTVLAFLFLLQMFIDCFLSNLSNMIFTFSC